MSRETDSVGIQDNGSLQGQLGIITLPRGFRSSGVYCGLKEKGNDLGLLVSELPTVTAARFTRNRFHSAPVELCREYLGKGNPGAPLNEYPIRAVVVNSGNANAATGERGLQDARRMSELVASEMELEPAQVLVCSTGIIGHFLPMERIEEGIHAAAQSLTIHHDEQFLKAIMTTDTAMKYAVRHFQLGGKPVVLGGVTKGAGMIHPNMATMLAFLTTDAAITAAALDQALGIAVQETFNCLSVDGDTSTSDTVILMANGCAANETIGVDHPEYGVFITELTGLCRELVRQMARDGEGATHLVRVICEGAFNAVEAHSVSRTIGNSLLVKTALYGNDPNWGRIICAVGNTDAQYHPSQVRLWVQGILLFEHGMPTSFDKQVVAEAMHQEEIEIRVNLGTGTGRATVYTCDLSYDYVRINAEYHT